MTEAELRAKGFVPEEEATPAKAPDVSLPEAPKKSALDEIGDYILRTNPATAGAKGVYDLATDPMKQVDRLHSGIAGATLNASPYLEALNAKLLDGGSYGDNLKAAKMRTLKAVAENPVEHIAGGIAAPLPGAGVKGAGGIALRIGSGALAGGAAEHFGSTEPSLEKDLVAAGAGGVLASAGEVMRGMFGGLKNVETGALSDLRAKGEAIERGNIASKLGSMRQQRADANRTVELIEAAANDPHSPHILDAQKAMSEPWFRDLKNGIQANALERAPDAGGNLRNAEMDFEAARSAAPVNLEAYMADKQASPLLDAAMPGIRRYTGRALGQAVGAEVGGPVGQFVGGAVGGSPGTWAGNLMRNPQFQLGAARAGQKLLSGPAGAAQAAPAAARTGTTFKDWLDAKEKEAQERLP